MCREIEEHMCREIERQKRSQKEFKLTIAGKVDKFIHVAETQVTTVLDDLSALPTPLVPQTLVLRSRWYPFVH